jgi:hypothetical protein
MAKAYLKLLREAAARDLHMIVRCPEEGDILNPEGSGYKAAKDAVESVEMAAVEMVDKYSGKPAAVFVIIPAYAADDEDIVDYGGWKAEALMKAIEEAA